MYKKMLLAAAGNGSVSTLKEKRIPSTGVSSE
jgi:hypothetical protein